MISAWEDGPVALVLQAMEWLDFETEFVGEVSLRGEGRGWSSVGCYFEVKELSSC